MSTRDIKQRLQKAIRTVPARDNIRKISLFGSHLHGTAKEGSDIDLLIELSTPVGFFTLASMELALSEGMGNKVDLVTPSELSKYFKDDVLREAEPIYEG